MLTTFFNMLLAIPQFVLALVARHGVRQRPRSTRPATSIRRRPAERLVVLIFALGIVSIPILARITRANSLQWSQREFVLAARAQGATNRRIMVREVLPNVLPAMFSIALLGIAVVIVAEGGLSILGVGVLPPAVSWGNMIASSRSRPRRRCRTWCSSRSCASSSRCCRSTTSATSCGPASTCGRARYEPRCAGKPTAERFADAPLDGPLLEVDDVKTFFKTPRGLVHAVDGVSLTLERGKTLGIVGESGSGKSVLSRSIMGLLPEQRRAARQHQVRGPRDRRGRHRRRCAHYWGTQMSMVFQDPMTSLNPVMRIGKQITESLRYHLDVSRDYAEDTALALLAVGRDPGGRAPARASTRTSSRAACASA